MPTPALRPELAAAALPARIARLPIDPDRHFPIPWFVSIVEGVPEFRAMDANKWRRALKESRCWVCGETLGHHRVFVLGPMCGINHTTSEPPCHAACAEWSARNCPFLSRPHMVRRDDSDLIAEGATRAGGMPLDRNPGLALLWWTPTYRTFRPDTGNTTSLLIEIGDAEQVRWFCEGRPATRAEVVAGVDRGIGTLRDACDLEEGPWRQQTARAELARRLAALEALYPDG